MVRERESARARESAHGVLCSTPTLKRAHLKKTGVPGHELCCSVEFIGWRFTQAELHAGVYIIYTDLGLFSLSSLRYIPQATHTHTQISRTYSFASSFSHLQIQNAVHHNPTGSDKNGRKGDRREMSRATRASTVCIRIDALS